MFANKTLNNAVKIVLALLAVGAFFGYKFYQKNEYKKDIRSQITEICSDSHPCLAAVDTHFDACFDKSYDVGGRYRRTTFNTPKFSACINENVGEEVLDVIESE